MQITWHKTRGPVCLVLICLLPGCQLSHHSIDSIAQFTTTKSVAAPGYQPINAIQGDHSAVANPPQATVEFPSPNPDSVDGKVNDLSQVVLEPPIGKTNAFTENELILLALERNPNVLAARYELDAASWSSAAAGALEDPRLTVTTAAEPIETANGPQDIALSFNQKLPVLSKRRKQRAIAGAAAAEAQARVAQAEQQVVADVRRGFAELTYCQDVLAILEADQELMSNVTQLALDKYRTNQANQQDVAQAELEELSLVEERAAARLALSNAQTAIARLLQIESGTPLLAVVEDDALRALPGDVQSLCRQATLAQPKLQALSARATQEHLKSDLERLATIPDPTVGATWVAIGSDGTSPNANGQDAVLVNFSVNLPVNRRRVVANVRSATARANGAMQKLDDQRAETLRDVYDAYSKMQTERELIELLENDVIPRVRETLETTIQAYRVSKANYDQVVDIRRQLLRSQLSLIRRRKNDRMALAGLEEAIGWNVVARWCRPTPSGNIRVQ